MIDIKLQVHFLKQWTRHFSSIPPPQVVLNHVVKHLWGVGVLSTWVLKFIEVVRIIIKNKAVYSFEVHAQNPLNSLEVRVIF